MTDRVTVNRDRTKLLPPGAAEKGWRITREEAVKLGLLESEEKPTQARRSTSMTKADTNGTPQRRRRNRGLNEDA
jgi:hypothetical protein